MTARKQPGRPSPRSPGLYVALLRGINVGGKNMLPMPELAALFGSAGCEQVRTYIQSGNVVFAATAACANGIPRTLPRLIQKQFGFAPPVLVRSAADLAQVVAGRPFPASNADTSVHVMFLGSPPTAGQVAGLDPGRSPGDSFVVRGSEIYLRLPSGAARTKFTNAYFDAVLGTVSTGRNWRTVLTLHALVSERGARE